MAHATRLGCNNDAVYRRSFKHARTSNVASAIGRREALGAGTFVLSSQLLLQPSQASTAALEPMEALKGKDYGKPRMT